jgi:hypothetical protein
MTDQAQTGCITRFTDGPCGNPPTSGLPICGSCLRTLLDEDDPRRRRTLAGNPGLAAGVVHHLAEDPDEQVRAQVAARADLDTATTNRLADPDRESAPVVWRSMAATPGGAAHAWELLGTDDPTTLAILAANPSVDPDILGQLSRYPDPDVSWTASATLSGQPSGDVISARVDRASTFDGLPLGEPPAPLSRPSAPSSADSSGAPVNPLAASASASASTVPMSATGASPPPPDSSDPPTPPSTHDTGADGSGSGTLPPRPSLEAVGDGGRRRGLALLVGAGALVVVAAVVLVVAFTGSDPDTRVATAGPDPATSVTMPEASAPPTTARSTTTTTNTTTTSPTTVPAPTSPPTTPAPVVPPPPGPISQNFSIRPTSGRFCRSVTVTVNFSPAPGYVVVTDDTGAQVGGWSGASGQTRQLLLPRSTAVLQVHVTAVGTSISVSGSAAGDSC